MSLLSVPLVSWLNGTIMIGVFVIVVIALIAVVYSLMMSDKKAK